MAKKKWITRLVYGLVGLAVVAAGYSVKDSSFSNVSNAILLLIPGVFLLASVAWKEFTDGKQNMQDVFNIAGAVFGAVLIISSILVLSDIAVWSWIQPIVPWAAGIGGVYMLSDAIFKWK